jgi:hypothetical protein
MDSMNKCEICEQQLSVALGGRTICDACGKRLGSHLIKGCVDPFDYALGTKSGLIVRWTGEIAIIEGEWLNIPEGKLEILGLGAPWPLPRGLQIRISEIVWVADAPQGS